MVDFMKKYLGITIIFLILLGRMVYLNLNNHEESLKKLENKTINYVYGESAPRGRILDRNGKVLVDNMGVKTLFYTKLKGVTVQKELEIARELAEIINISINENVLKKYWLLTHNNGDDLITEEEYEKLKMRKITSKDIENLKLERVKEEDINNLEEIEKKTATIYDLMNKGYSYAKKIISKNISDLEYSTLVDKNIEGVSTELTWERVYNYGDTLKDLFGSIGRIPEEEKEEYLKKGYNLNDIVGLSYLEKEYEDYLKGEKELYEVNSDNTLKVIKEAKNGNDLVLSIDIDVELKLESILRENIILGKKRKNTDYFSESYSIVGDPNTGEIIALSGQKLISLEDETFKSVNTNLINSSFTVGSVVKMATISTGYKYGVIDIGTSVQDGCIKLYQVPIKCSYKNLGKVNDLTAISKSSNYYQFKIAIGLTNQEYKYNMTLNTSENDFNKFRDMYKEYGLGNLTGIDLPNEKTGIKGALTSSDLLLNLSIGQYDTYTPMELFQYVNTIASSGVRRKPQLMKEIKNENTTIFQNDYTVLNNVSLDNVYLERLKEAMHLATTSGTARSYIKSEYNPAGKTGTSETFIDTNNDGVMDTKTTSIAFVGFAPYDNPKYSVVVLAPNIYVLKEYNYSKVYITRYISQSIMNFLFEKE